MNHAPVPRPRVALFVSCLVNVFRPSVAEAAIALLEQAGCEVEVPLGQSCCGQPGYNAGAIADARPLAKNLISTFEGYDFVVAPTGSCTGMIAVHYPRLLADEPVWRIRAEALAAKMHELTHFLHAVMGFVPASLSDAKAVTYHDSCAGLRELGIRDQPRALLAHAGVTVREMQATEVCCGFGGAFCAKLPAISIAMADEKLAHVAASGAGTLVGGDLGCLLHLEGRARASGQRLEVRHIAEVIADADVAGMARSYLGETADVAGMARAYLGQTSDVAGMASSCEGETADVAGMARSYLGQTADVAGMARSYLGETADVAGMARSYLGQTADVAGMARSCEGQTADVAGMARSYLGQTVGAGHARDSSQLTSPAPIGSR